MKLDVDLIISMLNFEGTKLIQNISLNYYSE